MKRKKLPKPTDAPKAWYWGRYVACDGKEFIASSTSKLFVAGEVGIENVITYRPLRRRKGSK